MLSFKKQNSQQKYVCRTNNIPKALNLDYKIILITKRNYCGLILVMRGIFINRNIFVVRKDDTEAYLDTDHDREFKVQLLSSLQ